MKQHLLISASVLLASVAVAYAGDADCEKIQAANSLTGSTGGQMKTTGYNFAMDTPEIYGTGNHTCSYLRDEAIDGEPAAVYREQYKASAGSTDATIWISKISGRLLREEQDGNIPGKGKGHISYRWAAPKQ